MSNDTETYVVRTACQLPKRIGGSGFNLPETSNSYHLTMDHYGNIVVADEGRCWRMVLAEDDQRPVKCPEPVAWVGRHQWRTGEWSKVWSCDGHAGDLVEANRIFATEARSRAQLTS